MGETLAVLGGIMCVLLVVLVPVSVAAGRRRERRRVEAMRAWAQANGWVLTERPAVDWGRRLPGGNRDGIGPALSATLVGRPVTVAEYQMTEVHTTSGTDGNGNPTTSTTTNTHHFTVVVVRLHRPLPEISVEPRPGLSRLKRALVGPGDTVTGHEPFDKAFRIRTDHPGAIPVWCTPPLIDAHLARQVPSWSLSGGELMTYTRGRFDPRTIPAQTGPALNLAFLLDPR